MKVEIIRTDNKNLIITVRDAETLEVRAPKNLSKEAIEGFVREKRRWIEKKAKEKQNIKNEFEEIYKYQQFLLFGKRFRVVKSNVTEATILEDMFIVPQGNRDFTAKRCYEKIYAGKSKDESSRNHVANRQ